MTVITLKIIMAIRYASHKQKRRNNMSFESLCLFFSEPNQIELPLTKSQQLWIRLLNSFNKKADYENS